MQFLYNLQKRRRKELVKEIFEKKISVKGRILLFCSIVLLVATLFFPLWKIKIEMPQTYKKLALLVYPNKIAGDLDEINIFNYRAGIRRINQEGFAEFKWFPAFLLVMATLTLLVLLSGDKRFLFFVILILLEILN